MPEKHYAILLAEDDEIAGEHQKKFLERKGHFVMLYKNGAALREDIYNGLKYDIAVIDLSLPEVDGDVIAHLSKELHSQIPVIIISGYYTGTLPPKGSNAYAALNCSDMFVAKPYDIGALEEKIIQILSLSEERQKQP